MRPANMRKPNGIPYICVFNKKKNSGANYFRFYKYFFGLCMGVAHDHSSIGHTYIFDHQT